MSKEKDIEYIKNISSINVIQVCKEVGVAKNNVYTGKASSEKIAEVKAKLKEKIKEIEEFEKMTENDS